MEICQHCGMYMKPMIQKIQGEKIKTSITAFCEFCGKAIAKVKNKKWVKEPKA